MSARAHRWVIRLAASAEADFEDIIRWSVEEFGEAQARTYAETISAALTELADGPSVVGVRKRDDIRKGLFTLHVARHGRRGRHLVMFRIRRHLDSEVIEVLRLLHDAMDLPRHLPAVDEGS